MIKQLKYEEVNWVIEYYKMQSLYRIPIITIYGTKDNLTYSIFRNDIPQQIINDQYLKSFYAWNFSSFIEEEILKQRRMNKIKMLKNS